jgi:hypothetical protein
VSRAAGGEKVRCGILSGGMVSAVRYILEVWGVFCHFSAHTAIAASLVAFFWLLMVCGSVISMVFEVRIASRASCFALLKPTKGAFLGNHRKTMLVLGHVSKMSLSFLRTKIDSFGPHEGRRPTPYLLLDLRVAIAL